MTEPVEAIEFGKMFESMGAEFEHMLDKKHPDLVGQAKLYVKEVRKGSLVADLIPLIQSAIGAMHDVKVVSDFADVLKKQISPFLEGRPSGAKSKNELSLIENILAPIAHEPNGTARIESVKYEKGVFKKSLEFKFTSNEARSGIAQVQRELLLLEQTASVKLSRVTMSFVRSAVTTSAVGKRSGELAVIEAISKKPLPVIYASELAEQKIKYEIKESEDNVFKKAFVVDVDVETRDGREIAYRITNVNQVFDLPE